MSKPKHPARSRDRGEGRRCAIVRISPQKLNLVAANDPQQAGRSAVATLTFSKRRIAQQVKKTLESAIANAENNHQLDVDASGRQPGRGRQVDRDAPLPRSWPRPRVPHREVVQPSAHRRSPNSAQVTVADTGTFKSKAA